MVAKAVRKRPRAGREGPGGIEMTDQSDELRRYLEYERRLQIEPDPFIADDLRDRMDLLWFEMSREEREWINNRGELN